MFDAGVKYAPFVNWIELNRYVILSFFALFFFASTFIFLVTDNSNQQNKGQFLIQFGFILFILYFLPMVLGFTFYFIIWHSILSIRNIVNYLRKDGLTSLLSIFKQMGFYSILAMLGVCLFGFAGFMFTNNNSNT